VLVSGGGAQSKLWLEILATVLGVELVRDAPTEGAAYGAALLAGIGAGTWNVHTLPSLRRDTGNAKVRGDRRKDGVGASGGRPPAERIAPQDALVETYARLYETYRALYPALRPTFAALSAE
jgi:xylulokinase